MKFIKELASVSVNLVQEYHGEYIKYVNNGEKYKEWDFFMFIFFPFFRSKYATEDLYVSQWISLPNRCDLYNEDELEKYRHIFINNGDMYKMANIHVKFLDGDTRDYYFKTNEEAYKLRDELINTYSLHEYKEY